MGVVATPLSRGGAWPVMWRGCVNEHTRRHTPPPLSRGESHGPGFKLRLFLYFLIAKHVSDN